MSKLDEMIHKLIALSCGKMCDRETWTNADHRLLVQTVDAFKDERRKWKASAAGSLVCGSLSAKGGG